MFFQKTNRTSNSGCSLGAFFVFFVLFSASFFKNSFPHYQRNKFFSGENVFNKYYFSSTLLLKSKFHRTLQWKLKSKLLVCFSFKLVFLGLQNVEGSWTPYLLLPSSKFFNFATHQFKFSHVAKQVLQEMLPVAFETFPHNSFKKSTILFLFEFHFSRTSISAKLWVEQS